MMYDDLFGFYYIIYIINFKFPAAENEMKISYFQTLNTIDPKHLSQILQHI